MAWTHFRCISHVIFDAHVSLFAGTNYKSTFLVSVLEVRSQSEVLSHPYGFMHEMTESCGQCMHLSVGSHLKLIQIIIVGSAFFSFFLLVPFFHCSF